MKLTTGLFQQHLGRMFRDHWKIQGKKKVVDNGALKALKAEGIEYVDALDIIKEKRPNKELEILRGFKPLPPAFDETHPHYNEIPVLTYGDHNVLVGGLNQAKVLTNTVELSADSLPWLNELSLDQELPLQDKLVKRCIKSSVIYDATQEKLPRRKDPLREAWRFPRDYGITDKRKNYLLVNRLLQLCSSFSPQLLGQRSVINEALFILPVTLPSEQKILFSVTGNAVVIANKHPTVNNVHQPSELELPDISPFSPTISLESVRFAELEPKFPLSTSSKLNKIHTVMLHYNETEVGNIFESPVTSDQMLGRSLMQAWILAMSQAMQDGADLSRDPITVQTVQTDANNFHFSVLQLNSTSCASASAPKNFFWSLPLMKMYDSCTYQRGLPVFEGYNPNVFKTLLAFYNNC